MVDLKWSFGLLAERFELRCCNGAGGAGDVELRWSGKV